MRRENQDAYSGEFLADHPRRVEALGQMIRGHPDVDDGQVRTMPADQGQEPRRVVGLAHHLEPGSFEQAPGCPPEQEVIVRPHEAQTASDQEVAALEHLASGGDAGESTRARRITQAAGSYIKDYAVPLVTAAQRDLGSARTVVETEEGKRSVDALRGRFERFMASERQIFRTGQEQADAAARRATVAATVSVAGSIVLILLSGGYLARSVVRPVRRASAMADRVAGGDLTVRMPETGPGEVGILERAFNSMAGSLETSTHELRRIAEEQAALRQVATLVARAVSPPEVFSAVAAETGRVLGADCTTVARFEPEGSVTIVGSWAKPGAPGLAPPLGSRWPAEEASVSGRVQRTGRPAWMRYENTRGPASAWAREHGIRSSAGSPIIVEGGLWGGGTAPPGGGGAPPQSTAGGLLP